MIYSSRALRWLPAGRGGFPRLLLGEEYSSREKELPAWKFLMAYGALRHLPDQLGEFCFVAGAADVAELPQACVVSGLEATYPLDLWVIAGSVDRRTLADDVVSDDQTAGA